MNLRVFHDFGGTGLVYTDPGHTGPAYAGSGRTGPCSCCLNIRSYSLYTDEVAMGPEVKSSLNHIPSHTSCMIGC